MAQKMTKKCGSIASKISALVIAVVIVSNIVCISLVVINSRNTISETVQNSMYDMVDSYSKLIEYAIEENGGRDLDYAGYSAILAGKGAEGMESSYIYVVDDEGTMLFHPTEEKVGNPVSNEVVKGLVEDIQADIRKWR